MAIQERPSPSTDRLNADALSEEWRRAQAEVCSIGATIVNISDELRMLLAREGELAQAEVADNTSAAKRAGMWGGIAAVVGTMALVFLGLTIMFAFATVLPLWAAALATAVLLLVVGAICGNLAKQQLRGFSVVPTRTLHSLQEDVRWAREQIKRNAA